MLVLGVCVCAQELKVAAWRADVTPPEGEPLIWVTPVKEVLDPLWAKGLVLEDGRRRYVLVAMDWCGISGAWHLALREAIARGAGTEARFVSLHVVHQHTAPYVDSDAYGILSAAARPPLMLSEAFQTELAGRLQAAAAEAVNRLEPVNQVGTGSTRVERVASARRLWVGGKLVTRFSTDGKKPELAALPEEPIDPLLRTVTLARDGKPLVRLHYYATHPQTWCCDGRVSADIAGAAREQLEKAEGVPQIYFTGGAGDVTVGKYNDGTVAAREALTARLRAGMRESAEKTVYQAATALEWGWVPLRLPARADWREKLAQARDVELDAVVRYRAASVVALAQRTRPLPVTSLRIGSVRLVHLPGEPMLEFQRFARQAFAGEFVAVAGYGDLAPGYLCTDEAHQQGGYEPSASNAGPGTEARVKTAIRRLAQPRREVRTSSATSSRQP
jgi:hypothetical protein